MFELLSSCRLKPTKSMRSCSSALLQSKNVAHVLRFAIEGLGFELCGADLGSWAKYLSLNGLNRLVVRGC